MMSWREYRSMDHTTQKMTTEQRDATVLTVAQLEACETLYNLASPYRSALGPRSAGEVKAKMLLGPGLGTSDVRRWLKECVEMGVLFAVGRRFDVTCDGEAVLGRYYWKEVVSGPLSEILGGSHPY